MRFEKCTYFLRALKKSFALLHFGLKADIIGLRFIVVSEHGFFIARLLIENFIEDQFY